MSAAILEVRGLSKAFGGVRAIDGIDLTLATGELRCIIGPNGAGKSTLFKLLLGSVKPDRGTIRFNERDITRLHPHQRAHLGIGVKFQNLGVYSNLSVRHNLQLPLQHTWSGDAMEREIAGLLERLNLSGTENQLVASLSHGQKQWLAIGMALAMRPALLLLDEPTAGMSPEERRVTGELLRPIKERCSMLIVEHDLEFIKDLSDVITVLDQGRVLDHGTPEHIESSQRVQEVYVTRV